MVAVIDYDAGNIKSVAKAVKSLGREAAVTRDRDEILSADSIILPGVGAFGDAMEKLTGYGLDGVIKEAAARRIPLLGICLGLQLFYEGSEESPGAEGLGLFKGVCRRFPKDGGLKVPQIGWNRLLTAPGTRLFEGLPADPYVYFVHSYYASTEESEGGAAFSEYGVRFTAALERDKVFACQFHPEKSGRTGLRILENFLNTQKG